MSLLRRAGGMEDQARKLFSHTQYIYVLMISIGDRSDFDIYIIPALHIFNIQCKSLERITFCLPSFVQSLE